MRAKINNKDVQAVRVGGYDKVNYYPRKYPDLLKSRYINSWTPSEPKLFENKAYRIVVYDSNEGNYSPDGLALYKMSDVGDYHHLKPIKNSNDWYVDFVAQGKRIEKGRISISNRSGVDKENLAYRAYIYEQPRQFYKIYDGDKVIMDSYIIQNDFKDQVFEYKAEHSIKGADNMLVKDSWYQLIFEDDGLSTDIGSVYVKNTDNAGYLNFRQIEDSKRWYINFKYDGLSSNNSTITLLNNNSTDIKPKLNGTLSLYKDTRSRS